MLSASQSCRSTVHPVTFYLFLRCDHLSLIIKPSVADTSSTAMQLVEIRARALGNAQLVGQAADPVNATAAAIFLDDLASQPELAIGQPEKPSPADIVASAAPSASQTFEVCNCTPAWFVKLGRLFYLVRHASDIPAAVEHG